MEDQLDDEGGVKDVEKETERKREQEIGIKRARGRLMEREKNSND